MSGVAPGASQDGPRPQGDDRALRVWIDLDNAPHAPFFRPIVAALRDRGCSIVLTARGDGQTPELARHLDLDARVVGGWRGGSVGAKVVATAIRAGKLALMPDLRSVDVAVSHGSRPLLLAAALRRIPAVTMYDYEGVSAGLFHRLSSTLLVPELMPPPSLPSDRTRLVRYPGLKEEVYLSDFRPDPDVRRRLGVGAEEILVVVRPESETAHYRAEGDSAILETVLDRLAEVEATCVALLPRSAKQGRRIREALESRGVRTLVPVPMDGRDLVWAADLVISGGGTMTREAAVLGVPAYSMFRGSLGAVDRHLAEAGRLVLIRSVEDAEKLRVERSPAGDAARVPLDDALPRLFADEICSTAIGRGS